MACQTEVSGGVEADGCAEPGVDVADLEVRVVEKFGVIAQQSGWPRTGMPLRGGQTEALTSPKTGPGEQAINGHMRRGGWRRIRCVGVEARHTSC